MVGVLHVIVDVAKRHVHRVILLIPCHHKDSGLISTQDDQCDKVDAATLQVQHVQRRALMMMPMQLH